LCPSSPSSLGEVSVITLIALTLVVLNPLPFFVALVAIIFTALPLPTASASCLPRIPVHQQHVSHPQTQQPLQPLVCQLSRCCHLWLFSSLWLIVTLSHWHQRPPLIVAAAVIMPSYCDCYSPSTIMEESFQKKKKAETLAVCAPPPKNVEQDIYEYVDCKNNYNFYANNLLIAKFPRPTSNTSIL
jgi:hypothetical protein